MSKLLSELIEESIAALDANPMPSRDQLMDLRSEHRVLLVKLQRFADTAETAHRVARTGVPLWGTAAACSQLYRELGMRIAGTIAAPVVVSIARFFPRRA